VSLKDKLVERIRENGPMTVAEFMGACLYDPDNGYYATRPALGGEGADFITAPEVSQMFGELIGLWCAHEWDASLDKAALHLIELGPGRGVLMQDALRATQKVEGFHDAKSVIFVEVSDPLRDEQSERVADADWAQRLEDVPPGPSLIVANEFLDCFPIRQFVRGKDAWHEKLVGLDEGDGLTFGLSAPVGGSESDDEAGSVREVAPGLESFMYELERRLHEAPGRALFIDYGYVAPEGADTLQALKGHRKVDPLEAPGEADLTAHVDFARVARLAEDAGLQVHGPVTQARFLRGLGIEVRADALAQANPGERQRIARQLQRLTGDEQMGVLFKAICLSSPNLPPPAGF
jgi:NADH dehydrogenase [ubiquinone] 1 alpha subcomplex assembly factor 7